MTYKKIEITETGKPVNKGTKTARALKSALGAIKKDFSNGTNDMADAWIKCNPVKKGQKAKKLKDGTVAMVRSMANNIKKSLKGITPKTALCDISYEIGGVLNKTKAVFNEYIDDITQIKTRKKNGK